MKGTILLSGQRLITELEVESGAGPVEDPDPQPLFD